MADLTIKDVRAKFPQYDDLDDQSLADALHGKFYADMPKPDFYAKIGFGPENAPADFADQTQVLEVPAPPAPRPDPRVPPSMPAAPSIELGPLMAGGGSPVVPSNINNPEIAPVVPAPGGPAPDAMAAIMQMMQPSMPDQVPAVGGPAPMSPRAAIPAPTAMSDDSRAARGFGRSAYGSDGTEPNLGLSGPSAQEQLIAMMQQPAPAQPAAPDPFAGEGFGPLAKRRGQQFARGATEVVASVPEAAALAGASADQGRVEGAAGFKDDRAETIAGIQQRLQDPNLPPDQRALLQRTLADMTVGQQELGRRAGEPVVPAADRPGYGYGDKIRKGAESIFGAPDPRDQSFWAGVAEGGGNMTALATTALLGPAGIAAGAGLGASMNAQQLYKEAREAGATEEDAMRAAKWGSVVGASEIIPINRALKLLPPRMRGKVGGQLYKRLSDIAQGSGEEAAQEYLATVANNLVAQNIYDPERGWSEGATEAAMVGAVLGGGMGAAGAILDRDGPPEVQAAPPRAPVEPRPTDEPPETTAPKSDATAPVQGEPDVLAASMMPDAAPVVDQSPAARIANEAMDKLGSTPAAQNVQQPGPAPEPRIEIMDETETVDGETRPTGRKVRVNLDTGEVSPLDQGNGGPDQSTAVQDQPQDTPDVGEGVKPAAGTAQEESADPISKIRTVTLPSEEVGKIETDAKTFQYKDNGDADGVTDRLQDVPDWDERSAMGGIVYEYADGRRVIADGHQRLGLAKRLQAAGKKTPWNVEVIREADGYTPADVRRIAALKNIREGSGTAIDAAKVLRESPEDVDALNLPPKSALVRDARGLANLSDEAFGAVINQVVRPEWGAAVGQNVPDQALHSDIIGLLAKLQPKNNEQAAMIARQAAQETVTETQTSLFGDEQVSENLYLERAKVLDGAIKRLKQDKATFKVLSDRADTIAKAGNVLNSEANAARVEEDGKAQAYLTAEANRKGPISDALTAAAKELKANPKAAGRIVSDFLKAIRNPEPETGRPDGAGADPEGEGRPQGVQAEPAVKPDPAPTGANLFGETPEAEPEPEPDDGPGLFGDQPTQTKKPDTSEAEAIANQGKIRRLGGNTGDAGPLFDDQGDMLAGDNGQNVQNPKAGTYVNRDVRPADAVFRDRSNELPDRIDPAKLGEEAKRLTLEPGAKAGIEYLMMIDGEGQIIAYGSGTENGTGVPGALMLLVEPDERIVIHHNHPGGSSFSAADYSLGVALGAESVYAHGENGTTFRFSATNLGRAMWRTPGQKITTDSEAKRVIGIKRELDTAIQNLWRSVNPRLFAIMKAAGKKPDSDLGKQMQHDFNTAIMLAMQEAGIIDAEVTGPDAERAKPDVNTFFVEPELKKAYDRFVKSLKAKAQAAAETAKGGRYDRPTGTTRHLGDLAGVSQENAGAAGRDPSNEQTVSRPAQDRDSERETDDRGQEDRQGDVTGDADFDAALDDVLGDKPEKKSAPIKMTPPPKKAGTTPKPSGKRSKADIAKDMQNILRGLKEDGDLFGTTPQPSRTMTERQRAELEARAKQSKMRTGKAQQDAGPLFGDQNDLFGGLEEKTPESIVDLFEVLENVVPGWTSSPGGMLANPHTRGGIIDKEAQSDNWFIVFGNGWKSFDGLPSRGAAVAEFVRSSKANTDPTRYRQLAPLFIEALDGIDVGSNDRRGTFVAMIRPLAEAGLTREDIVAMKPYFDRFLADVESGIIDLEGDTDAPGSGTDLERDSGDADAGDGVGATDVPPSGGRDGDGPADGAGAVNGGGGRRTGGGRVPSGDASGVGVGGNRGVSAADGTEPGTGGRGNGTGSSDAGKQGLPDDRQPDQDTARDATDGPEGLDRRAAQDKADKIKVRLTDEQNIADTLPLLLPEQHDDVLVIERRFAKDDGHGMLLTNGTGTGKTYSGGGVIKRMVQAGKTNILIVAPDDGIMNAWLGMGDDLGIPISALKDTQDAGKGVVVTTYANMGQNDALASRDWDLVVTDEAHKLSQNAAGDPTRALNNLRAITNHPDGRWRRPHMVYAKDWDRWKAMPDGHKKEDLLASLNARGKKMQEEYATKPRGKVLFLSATPFSYDKTMDYAQGYLFEYGSDGVTDSGSRQSGRNFFFVQNFGYRIKYHKLTRPEGAVDNSVFEREMHERLKREGSLAGRSLTVSTDYDRKFVAKESDLGNAIDTAFDWLRENRPKEGASDYDAMVKTINANFAYHHRMQLLEAIKAEASVEDIRKHLDIGRKVVLFHDFNKGGGLNPFDVGHDMPTDEARAEWRRLMAANPKIAKADFGAMRSPLQAMRAEFGKRAAFYNGTEKREDRRAAIERFNDDNSGTDLIVVQADAGSAGISLHDTTGDRQRVLINLGMPPKPTTALQEEGRIRRVGVKTNAAFRYYTIGTTWERAAFAQKIAGRSGTVENLALGNEARAIRESFIDAYTEADTNEPSDTDGTGGMDRDRANYKASPFDVAKTHYFGRMKNARKRNQRQGFDFYATPEPLGYKMVEWAGMRPNEKVLEPSVGDGAIGRYFPEHVDSTIIDPSNDLLTQAQLRVPGARAENDTFERHHIVNKYDVITMNPPFGSGGKMAAEHVSKAAKHLKVGGRIVALVPTGPAADKQFLKLTAEGGELYGTDWQWTADVKLPTSTFEKAGTGVSVRVMIWDRLPKGTERKQTKNINLTGAQNIGEFFDRLEDIGVPPRPDIYEQEEAQTRPDAIEAGGAVSPAITMDKEGLDIFAFWHTQTGKNKHGVQIKENLGDRFREVANIAKAHNGYYSRYQNKEAGAKRGFLFNTEADRAAFIEDISKPQVSFEQPESQWTTGEAAGEAVGDVMPQLRAELDRLNLKRVNLGADTSGQRRGAFQSDGDGMSILVAPSLDAEATLHHEALHAMKAMNLFTPTEWKALEVKAARTWVEQYKIAETYPDLLPSEQIEEAIAEAFADAAKTRTAPKGSLLVQAFNKIARIIKALGNALRGAGYQTAEDVFGRAMSGEVGARDIGAGFQQTMREARLPRRQTAQQAAHMATAMGANGGSAHIPDRRIWEELSASNAGIWQRLKSGGAAANDWADKARIKIQDRFLPVMRAQEAIVRQTGRPLPQDHNAYLAEETFSGKVGRHLFEIDEDYTKTIIDIMAGGKGEGMLDTEYVGTWLYARHAQERNAQIAKINPNMPDGGSGMMDADAAQIMATAAASSEAARLRRIGDLIDDLRERTLTLRQSAGLITRDEADLWRTQYKHYVPLKGFVETDHSEAMLDVTGIGRRFNTRGPESKRALGRQSEAFNPLQAAITQAQEVAIRAEKNRVGQALHRLAKDNPSPRLWSVKKPKQKRFYNRTTGLVETRVEDPVSLFLEPNEMAVKINGEEHRILFHDARLAQAAGTVGADQMGWFISLMSKASRFFSSVNTMLDPEFVIRNAFRDMTAAQINIRNFGADDRNAIAKAMIKTWPKAFAGAYRGQMNKADTEWTKYYREFEKAGAKVSFWKLEQPEADKKDLERRVKLAGGSVARRASRFVRFSTRDNPVLGFIERTNLAVDNAIRLAAYVEARKRGWTKADAASLSKNMTVNFNRRGEWGATINALYPFANAGIQGTQILFRAMTSKRMAKYAFGMVALGAILDAVNAGLSEEDDDGELAYDKIPDWKNQMNMVVMLGPQSGDAATLCMPYGYNLFPYLGQQVSKVARGVKEPGDAMGDYAAAIFGSFSPLGGRDLQSVLTPTMLDPINEMAMNEDWLGRPIRPESPYADFGPDAYKYFGGASTASKMIADGLNRGTGGTIAEPGMIDVSPEYLDHIFGFATGGAGRFYGRTTDTVAKLMTGELEEIEARNVPFYRSLQYKTGDYLDRERYYRFREEVKEARDAAKTYGEVRQPVPGHVSKLAGLYSASKEADKLLRKIRSARVSFEDNKSLTRAEISRRRAALDERAAKVYLGFNRTFIRAMGPQGE